MELPERFVMAFAPQKHAHPAFHVDDVAAALAALEAQGVVFAGDTFEGEPPRFAGVARRMLPRALPRPEGARQEVAAHNAKSPALQGLPMRRRAAAAAAVDEV